jgi:hypothetical protein
LLFELNFNRLINFFEILMETSSRFRLLKIPSGGIPDFKPLQRYNRCGARVTRTFSERYMAPV